MTQRTMRSVALRGFGGTDQLTILETPVPDADAGPETKEAFVFMVSPGLSLRSDTKE